MKKIKILFLFIMTLACMKSFSQTQYINISTGFDQSVSFPMSYGIADPEWQVKGPSATSFSQAYVNVGSTWTSNGYCSEWVTPSSTFSNFLGGNYIYRVNFTPYNQVGCNASNIISAKIVFSWSDADDELNNIKINSAPLYTYPVPGYTDKPGIGLSNTFPKGTSYTVNIPPSNIFNGVNTLDFEVFNWTDATYPKTPNGLNICATVEITYAGILTPTFTTSPSVCYGSPITVTGSPSNDPTISNYVWIISECTSAGVPFGSDYWAWAPTPGLPGTYTFPYVMPGLTIGCGKYYKIKLAAMNPCSNWGETSQIIYVNCPPGADAGADQTICSGNCATLSGTSPSRGVTYSWSNGSSVVGTTAQISVCPTTTTTYTLTVTKNTTGCVSTDVVTVFVENLDPNFSLSANTTNSSYLTLTATPNQTTGIPSGFGYFWNVDELDGSLNTIFSINSNGMAPCWWNYTSPEVFSGFDGVTYTFTTSPCTPSIGQFKYNTNYRITRGVWSTNCLWRQTSFVIMYTKSSGNGITIVEDPNAPDMSGYANTGTTDKSEIHGVSRKGLKLYPNPANGLLNIEYKLADKISGKILITDLVGRTLKTIVITEGNLQTQVDVSDLINGIYFVNLYESGKLSETKKIIVAK